jgi:hypothetical protein
MSGRFHVSRYRLGGLRVVSIDEHSYPNGRGQFAKEFKSLCSQFNWEQPS